MSAGSETAGFARPHGLAARLGQLVAHLDSADRRLLRRGAPPREAALATLGPVGLCRTRRCFMARTTVKGESDTALPTALQRLAAYSGGDNREGLVVPVARPVVWRPAASRIWQAQIGLPGVYAAAAAPLPCSGKLRIIAQPSETLALLRQPGRPSKRALADGEAAIRAALAGSAWTVTGAAMLRLHTAPALLPWTGWFEVALPVDDGTTAPASEAWYCSAGSPN